MPGAVLVLLGYGDLAEIEPRLRPPRRPTPAGVSMLLPAVPPSELLDWVASADVVAMPIQPTTLNHRLTTPNKLFEAMAAGVPVVASDLPGMAPIVRETGCGIARRPDRPGGDRGRPPRRPRRCPPTERQAMGAAGLAAVAHDRTTGRRRPSSSSRSTGA